MSGTTEDDTEEHECPWGGCEYTSNSRGVKVHHARKHGESIAKQAIGSEKPWQDGEVLRELYTEQRLTAGEIGDKLGTTKGNVLTWLSNHDIEARMGRPRETEELADRSTLRKLYVEDGLSTSEVGDELGCGAQTVANWLKRHDIPIRHPKALADERLADESAMREMYSGEQMNTPAIAERLGTTVETVCRWMRRHGIETQGGGWRTADALRDEEKLRRVYEDEGMTTQEIAAEWGCGASAVGVWLHHHDIPTRPSHAPSGPEHPLWNAGSTLRRQVTRALSPRWGGQQDAQRERDDGTCQRCGKAVAAEGKKMAIHHIVPVLCGGGNGDYNLMSLCASCHKSADWYTKQSVEPVLTDWTADELPEGRERWRPDVPAAEQATFATFGEADD